MTDDELTQQICTLLGMIPGWAWRPEGPAYLATEVGIFYGPIGAAPDRAVGVRVYATYDADFLSQRRVQLRFRGPRNTPNGADKLAAPAVTLLQGVSRRGGISGISRRSMSPSGADGNGRDERTENYDVTLDNLEASL